jgi:hypothetical protein
VICFKLNEFGSTYSKHCNLAIRKLLTEIFNENLNTVLLLLFENNSSLASIWRIIYLLVKYEN